MSTARLQARNLIGEREAATSAANRRKTATTARPRRRDVPPRPLSAALFALCLILYAFFGAGWDRFALLLLAPDLAALALLASPRWGALAYNAAHRAPAPALLTGAGLLLGTPLAASLGLIWLAHVAIDWLLGYGLFVVPTADPPSPIVAA